MSTLILVRHAATALTGHRYVGRSDPPLSPDGHGQASALATELARSTGTKVRLISSPSRRARETAAYIAAAAPGLRHIELDDRWREADFGAAEGMTFDELASSHPGLADRLAAGETGIDWPAGETADALAGRVQAAVADLREALVTEDHTTIVVAHAGPIRVAVAALTGTPLPLADGLAPASFIHLDLPADAGLGAALLPSRR